MNNFLTIYLLGRARVSIIEMLPTKTGIRIRKPDENRKKVLIRLKTTSRL